MLPKCPYPYPVLLSHTVDLYSVDEHVLQVVFLSTSTLRPVLSLVRTTTKPYSEVSCVEITYLWQVLLTFFERYS